MLEPVNDLAKIKLDKADEYGFGSEKDTAESGILVALPDEFDFFGFWSFAFEDSFMNAVKLKKLHERWSNKLGQRVHWTALSEKGNIIEENGERYAFVKFTSLIACSDPDTKAHNIHNNGGASFSV